MRLVELLEADICRDGGSYEARFLADDGEEYGLWLECSRAPAAAGLHHRWLFEYRGSLRPVSCVPVVAGSEQERALLLRLDAFLEAPVVRIAGEAPVSDHRLQRLRELRDFAVRREPCLPAATQQHGFVR